MEEEEKKIREEQQRIAKQLAEGDGPPGRGSSSHRLPLLIP